VWKPSIRPFVYPVSTRFCLRCISRVLRHSSRLSGQRHDLPSSSSTPLFSQHKAHLVTCVAATQHISARVDDTAALASATLHWMHWGRSIHLLACWQHPDGASVPAAQFSLQRLRPRVSHNREKRKNSATSFNITTYGCSLMVPRRPFRGTDSYRGPPQAALRRIDDGDLPLERPSVPSPKLALHLRQVSMLLCVLSLGSNFLHLPCPRRFLKGPGHRLR